MGTIPKVIVIWLGNLLDTTAPHLLVCREGVRVYSKDKLDTRCGDIPYFRKYKDAVRYMLGEGGGSTKAVQLNIDEARSLGLLEGEREAVFS